MMKKLKHMLILGGALMLSQFTQAGNPVKEESKAPCPTVAMSGSPVSCYGQSNGTAQVSISNGSGDYTINWSNGANVPVVNGLTAGTYTVTVRDNVSGCTVNGAYVVNTPDPIAVSPLITDVACNGQSTGIINITVTGGNGGNNFAWTNSAGASVSNLEDLNGALADDYSVVVTDSKGCQYTGDYSITQPMEALQMSVVSSDALCFGSASGELDISVWGGTPSYTYNWSNGESTQDVNGLTMGSYTVTITDFNGCTLNNSYFIGEPTQISGSATVTNVLCNGDFSGEITYAPTGGTTPYNYQWQNATTLYAVDNATITGVPAENYLMTLTDANGCVFQENIQVTEPSELTLTHTYTDISCFGFSDGEIDILPTGGVLPYSFQWTNSFGTVFPASEDLNGVPTETYSVTVTDNNGCTVEVSQFLDQPDSPIEVQKEVTHVKCYGNNTGAIDLTTIGGTSPYLYSWNTGQTTQDVNGLLSAVYTFLITDANGCSYTDTSLVSQPLAPLSATATITPVACFGDSAGVIDVNISGGTAPYGSSWTNSEYQLSVTLEDLVNYPADWYINTIIDANNCVFIDTFTVGQPNLLESSLAGIDILCKGDSTGSVDLSAWGGVMPYTYSWSNGQITEDINNLVAGDYSVSLTDANNCVVSDSITLIEPNDSLRLDFSVVDVRCNDGMDGMAEAIVTGGTFPYDYDWTDGDTTANVDNLLSGYYAIVVTDAHGCAVLDSTFIDQPDPIVYNELITPVTCNGLSDGEIDLNPSGGTAPYTYTWYNSDYELSAQTEDISDFPADVYQLEVIDSNGCFYEIFMDLPEPENMAIDYTYNVVSCFGGSDGNIDVTVTGGNGGYIYEWSNGAMTEDQTNIPTLNYSLVVTDSKDCQDSIEVFLSQPEDIVSTFEVEPVTCIDQFDGTAYATATGGNGGYTYLWSNGQTDDLATGLDNIAYTLTVTDILGCTGVNTVMIPKDSSGCVFPVNAFSPNGDDYNDTWIIDNMELYDQAELKVYNKWGGIVHEQVGIYEPWNGTFNGNPLPSEVYYYILDLKAADREVLKGIITIIR